MTRAVLNNPFDLVFLPDGSLVFSDTFNHCIRSINPVSNIISTICGTGVRGFFGDGGSATRAMLNEPYGIVINSLGDVFFADSLNRCVRVIGRGGVITTLAELVKPNGLALSPDESQLFIADVGSHRVYVADLPTGMVRIFAGTGKACHDGDGDPATQASILAPVPWRLRRMDRSTSWSAREVVSGAYTTA